MTRELDFTEPEVSPADRMRQYNKTYRLKHSQKITCPCGGEFKWISKYSHQKTLKHLQWTGRTQAS